MSLISRLKNLSSTLAVMLSLYNMKRPLPRLSSAEIMLMSERLSCCSSTGFSL
nr:hypothetical protein [Marinomonas aquiplantarum]